VPLSLPSSRRQAAFFFRFYTDFFFGKDLPCFPPLFLNRLTISLCSKDRDQIFARDPPPSLPPREIGSWVLYFFFFFPHGRSRFAFFGRSRPFVTLLLSSLCPDLSGALFREKTSPPFPAGISTVSFLAVCSPPLACCPPFRPPGTEGPLPPFSPWRVGSPTFPFLLPPSLYPRLRRRRPSQFSTPLPVERQFHPDDFPFLLKCRGFQLPLAFVGKLRGLKFPAVSGPPPLPFEVRPFTTSKRAARSIRGSTSPLQRPFPVYINPTSHSYQGFRFPLEGKRLFFPPSSSPFIGVVFLPASSHVSLPSPEYFRVFPLAYLFPEKIFPFLPFRDPLFY